MDRHPHRVALSLIALGAVALDASAHGDAAERSGIPAIVVVVMLAATLALYVGGIEKLWRTAGRGRGVSAIRAAAFATGWLVVAIALFALEAPGERTFTAHMIQHELLMLVAAPLLVVGAPLAAWSWGLPDGWRDPVLARSRAIGASRSWDVLTRPFAAWLLHAFAIWTWHVPVLFTAALEHPLVHDLQHTTFLATALLFWWSVAGGLGARRPEGASMLLLFTTMLHTGALGALLAFSRAPWYPSYTGQDGWTALEDQQLGGLVMWLPGGIVYLIAALVLMAAWLREPKGVAKRV